MAKGLIGNLVVNLLADTKKFDKSMQTAISKAKSFEKRMSRVGSAIQAVGKRMTLFVTGPLVGLGIAAVRSAAKMEMQQVAFETMLGSAERARNMLEQLEEFAARTPFQLTDLAQGTKTMLSFGIAAEKVLPNLKQLGDIAQGDSARLRSLTLAFSQIQSTGRLMGQDLLQLINVGFNPLQVISQKTGETMAELKDRMSDGRISAIEVAEAFKVATSEGGLFFKGMERASKTLSGLWSTLKDNLGALGRSFAEILLPPLKDLVQRITEIVQRFTDLDERQRRIILTIAGIVAAIGPLLLAVGTAIKLIGTMKLAFVGLNAVMAANPFIAVAMAALALGAAAVWVVKNWDKVKNFFAKFFNKLWDWIDRFRDWINKAPDWIFYLVAAFAPFIGVPLLIIKNWDKLTEYFSKAIAALVVFVQKSFYAMTIGVLKAISGVLKGVSWLAKKFGAEVSGIEETIANFNEKMEETRVKFEKVEPPILATEIKIKKLKENVEELTWEWEENVDMMENDVAPVFEGFTEEIIPTLTKKVEELTWAWDEEVDMMDHARDTAAIYNAIMENRVIPTTDEVIENQREYHEILNRARTAMDNYVGLLGEMDAQQSNAVQSANSFASALDELAAAEERLAETTAGVFQSSFVDAWEGIFTGAKNAKDAIKDFLSSFLQGMGRMLAGLAAANILRPRAALKYLAGSAAMFVASAAVKKLQAGADFVTQGPQMVMVGDNPGGRERVQVTPLSSPNYEGPAQTITLPITFQVGNEVLYKTIERGIDNKKIRVNVKAIR